MTNAEKRKLITEKVLGVCKIADEHTKDKPNYNYYKAMLEIMNEKEFMAWASTMGHELDDTIQIHHPPFQEVSSKQIKQMLDFLNVPDKEYIYYHDKASTPIRSRHRVDVGFCPMKTLQQFSNKKNKVALDSDKRAQKTGQTTGESKGAAISDLETYMIMSIGGDKMLEELYGPRADGYDKKHDFYQQITNYGSANLDELEVDLTKHTTLNTINTYLLASGIRTDLVTSTLKTAYTLKKELGKDMKFEK